MFALTIKLSRTEKTAFLAALLLFSAASLAWNQHIDDPLTDFLFQVRGQRQLADELVFVHISDEDIAAHGSWPITRDFFGYMTYVLDELGANTIAVDFLFSGVCRIIAERRAAFCFWRIRNRR